MSIHLFVRRGRCWTLALLACGLALAGRLEAGTLDPILPTNYGYVHPGLDLGNASKVAVGRANQINAVLADVDSQNGTSNILFEWYDPLNQIANQPSVWEDYTLTSNGTSYLPALAVDSDGTAVVVWVSKPSAQSVLGSLWYTYQTSVNCSYCWSTPRQIVYYGTEPSLIIDSHVVYMAWTTRDRVQFTSFPKTAPPSAPLWLGDVVDFTNCPNSQFHQPAIAYVRVPCDPLSLKIATLYAADEQATAGPCHDASTHVGPRIYERDNATTAWSEIALQPAQIATDSTPGQPFPLPISLSLSATRMTGDFFLAWSDEIDSVKRTQLGHGNGSTWDFTPLDTLGHHVHVAAQGGGAAGKFRLAVSDQNGWSTGAYTQTGKWSGGTLSWTSGSTQIAGGSLPEVENPQAFYWSRCSANQRREIKVYTEADDNVTWDPFSQAATDLSQPVSANCHLINIGDAIHLPNCWTVLISISQMHQLSGRDAVVVDLGDSVSAISLTDAGAAITTLGGGTIQATWQPGDLIASWDTGFAVATPRSSVQFSSKDTRFEVQDLNPPGTAGGK
jgi:hypothetical protein